MAKQYSYSVSENNVVSIWNNAEQNGKPVILQPTHPDGTSWTYEAATAWATAKVALLTGNPNVHPTPIISSTITIDEEILES